MKNLIRALVATAIAIGGLTVVSTGSVSAHHPVIESTVERPCGEDAEWYGTVTASADADRNKDWRTRIEVGVETGYGAWSAYQNDEIPFTYEVGPFSAATSSVVVTIDGQWSNGESVTSDFRQVTLVRPEAYACEEEAPVAFHVNSVDNIECGDTEWSATVTVTVTATQWNLGWSSDGVAWQQVTELAPGSYTITFGPYPAADRFVQINVYAWWDGGSYDTNRPGRQWDALEPTHYSCPDTTVPTEETVPDTTVPVTTTPPVTTVPTPETTTVTTIVIPEPTPTTLAPTPVPTLPKVSTTNLPTTGTDPGVLIAIAVLALIVGTIIVTEERRVRRNRRKPVADMEVIY